MAVLETLWIFIGRLPSLLLGSGELGIIYAVMALGVFISFRTLNTPDMTVDGSFVLGAAVSAVLAVNGHPVLGLIIAFIAGVGSGCVTSLINTKLGINPLLSGILVMLGLYSINLRAMGKQPNIPINKPTKTIYSLFEPEFLGDFNEIILSLTILLVIVISLYFFLRTRFGFVLRATGDNENMVKAAGVNTDFTKLLGLALANGLAALSGGMIGQFQRFSDIQMGTGMVVIGLSSVIIGEVVFGTKPLLRRLIAVVLGAVLYRFIISLAYEVGLEASDLKLVSAVIVTIALSAPKIRSGLVKFRNRSSTDKKAGDDNA